MGQDRGLTDQQWMVNRRGDRYGRMEYAGGRNSKQTDIAPSKKVSMAHYHIPINDLLDFNSKVLPEKSEVFSRTPPC